MTTLLSDYLRLFINLTIPGFLYLIGIIILIQGKTGIKILSIFKQGDKFLLYIGIIVVVFSFILGLSVHLAEQGLQLTIKSIVFFFSEKKDLLDKLDKGLIDPKKSYKSNVNLYGVLIMLRHLILSIIFIVFSLSFYLNKKLEKTGFYFIIYCSLILILLLAYFKIKYMIDLLYIGFHVPWYYVAISFLVFFAISLITFFCINRKKSVNTSNS